MIGKMKHHLLSAAALLLSWTPVVHSANTGSNEDISIDPNTVTPQTRMKWCDDQSASCATLCGDEGVGLNSCDHNTLDYACTCSNGSTPGLQYYTKTMPTYICEESYRVCDGAADGDAGAEKDCDDNIKSQCGTLDQSTLAQESNSDPASTGGSTGTATTGGTATGSAATSMASTSTASNSTSGSGGDGSSDSKGSDSNVAFAAGGVVCACLILAGVAYVFYRRGKNHAKKHGNGVFVSEDNNDNNKGGPGGPFEKLKDSGDGWSAYEMDTTTTERRPVEMPAPAYHSPVAELASPKVFVAELDDTSCYRTGSKTVSEREDAKFRM